MTARPMCLINGIEVQRQFIFKIAILKVIWDANLCTDVILGVAKRDC